MKLGLVCVASALFAVGCSTMSGDTGGTVYGPPGPAGVAGPPGSTGPSGPAGVQGPAGPAGIGGSMGAAGAQGSIGAAGAQGSIGAAGAQGPIGATGTQGSIGAAGAQGPAGAVVHWESFRDFLFDFDKSDVRASEAEKAPEIAAYMKTNPSIQVGIDGYADPRGTNQYNLALSQRRVEAVREALIQAGVPADRIQTGFFGEARLKCSESTEACWQRDRRVEVFIGRDQ
jgi:outer membrane protein OmpA-like peptidoglycan-associated protein